MPVLSPHRSSSSGLNGSYRSSYGSSALDRPYTNSYHPRMKTYSEHFTTRSYIDGDGRAILTRTGSITEDGITTRFREDRETSLRRDSRDLGISSIREGSIHNPRRDRDLSLTRSELSNGIGRNDRESRLSALSVVDSIAELHNKYSPANYVPAILRKNENISRSKSINDIGLPPPAAIEGSKKVNEIDCYSINSSGNTGLILSNTTNNEKNDNIYIEDDNGNRPSVMEICKKFDNGDCNKSSIPPLNIEGVKISENPFKKEDSIERRLLKANEKPTSTSSSISTSSSSSSSSLSSSNTTMTRHKKTNSELKKNGDDRKIANNKLTSDAKLIGVRCKQNANEIDKCDADNKKRANNKLIISDKKTKLKVNNNKKEEVHTNGTDVGRRRINNNSTDSLYYQNGIDSDINSSSLSSSNNLSSSTDLNNKYSSRTNNFASYISSKDYDKGDVQIGNNVIQDNDRDSTGETILKDNNTMDKNNLNKRSTNLFIKPDVTVSPRLNRGISQNVTNSTSSPSGPSTSNSLSNRNSLERDNNARRDDDKYYDRYNNTSNNNTGNIGLNGLKNIGNTCFMNSVIQCLSNTKLLMEYLKKDSYVDEINTSTSSMKGALIKAFSQVIKELWSEDSSDRVVNTLAFKSQVQRYAPRFIGYAQQDAQEFLRYLLEGLHEDVNRVTSKPTPISTEIDEKLSDDDKAAESWRRYLRMDNSKIVDIFVGQLKSTLRCTHCGHCSVTFDPFWDLSLPIPQKAGPVKLSQCLEYFTREETLDGDEKPTCSKCKERRKCTKSFTIQKFPKILVIHLKRFSPTERYRGKLSITVDFPLESLDMRNYAADSVVDSRYNLYAISNHSGTTYSGHYTAYCRHPYTHTWHEYNDSRVTSLSSKSLISGEAYVLFYELDSQKAHL